MGICRDIQLINVALGGTLIQDILSKLEIKVKHMQENPRSEASYKVLVDKTSILFECLGEEKQAVNSLHHQSINQLGDGLKVRTYSAGD